MPVRALLQKEVVSAKRLRDAGHIENVKQHNQPGTATASVKVNVQGTRGKVQKAKTKEYESVWGALVGVGVWGEG